jgi:sec-independent protein translocase protein TatA
VIERLLSPMHLLLILAVALIALGPKRLPEAGRGLGSAIRGFRDSLSTPEHRDERSAIEPSREPDRATPVPVRPAWIIRGPMFLDSDVRRGGCRNGGRMADIGRPEREIEIRPGELPLPRELPIESPVPGPAEPAPAEEPVPA